MSNLSKISEREFSTKTFGQKKKKNILRMSVFVLLVIGAIFVATIQAQTTPTPIPTPSPDNEKNLLENRKLVQEIEKLRLENQLKEETREFEKQKLIADVNNSNREWTSLRGWWNLFYTNISIFAPAILAFLAVWQYLATRRQETRKRDEERFEKIVAGLGGERAQERINAAVLLQTFLAKGYERFYTQVFNLATGNLRLIASEKDTEKKDNKELKPSRFARRKTTSKSDYSPSQSIIAQPLSNIFLKSYKSARDNLSEKTLWNSVSLKSNFWQKLISGNKLLGIIPLDIKPKIPTIRQNLNASEIELNGVYLTNADFDYAWLRDAQIKDSNLTSVNFHTAVLENCFISDTDLSESVFTNANIQKAYFLRAILNNAVFTDSKAESVKFEDLTAENVIFLNATLKEAKFIHVKFVGGNFKGADLSDATFNEIEFCRFNEVQPNIEMAILKNTVFNGVKGLTKDQLAKCRENGATFVGYTE